MKWVIAGLLVAAALLGHTLGTRLGRRSRRAALTLMVALFPILVLRGLVASLPELTFVLFPFSWYAALHPWWGFLPAFVFMGAAGVVAEGRLTRLAAGACALLILVPFLLALTGMVWFRADYLGGTPGDGGMVMQTTGYSCGPAAAATLLSQAGIATTEREMALLCRTNPVLGTDPVSAVWGLRRKAGPAGYDVQLQRVTPLRLVGLQEPCLALIRYSAISDHWLVVLHAGSGGVIVADPDAGVYRMSWAYFLRQWRGIIITLDPPGDERPSPPPRPGHLARAVTDTMSALLGGDKDADPARTM